MHGENLKIAVRETNRIYRNKHKGSRNGLETKIKNIYIHKLHSYRGINKFKGAANIDLYIIVNRENDRL
jgi:predicted component of viral defense system (DUF524 family)